MHPTRKHYTAVLHTTQSAITSSLRVVAAHSIIYPRQTLRYAPDMRGFAALSMVDLYVGKDRSEADITDWLAE